MNITPHHIAAVYDMLRAFKPFSGWKLPEAESVGFHIKPLKDYGEYFYESGHHIVISNKLTDAVLSLMEVVAHEMIHLRQVELKRPPNHNKDFRRMAKAVCREFLWDVKRFIG